jgi:glycosyltransferase involved in cell wall biosynthesis
MKIYVHPARENWIVDRIVEEWKEYNPLTVPKNITEIDIVWIPSNWLWRQIDPSILQNKPVVVSVHHVDEDKFNHAEFMARDSITDAYHVPNKFTKEFIEQYTTKPIRVIGYWYDPAKWYQIKNPLFPKFRDPEDETFLWGSFQRDTEGSLPLRPKLAKGPDLLAKYLKSIEFDQSLLLGGWRRQYIMEELKDTLPIKYHEKALLAELRMMYSVLDCYLVTSRCEGGPQAILECAAMKVPILSTNVGMASDVLHPDCVFDSIEDFPKDLYELRRYYQKYVDYNYYSVQEYNIEMIKDKYLKMFKEVKGE